MDVCGSLKGLSKYCCRGGGTFVRGASSTDTGESSSCSSPKTSLCESMESRSDRRLRAVESPREEDGRVLMALSVVGWWMGCAADRPQGCRKSSLLPVDVADIGATDSRQACEDSDVVYRLVR